MAAESLKHGLSAEVVQQLRMVFSRFPGIERVLIFGSRAKGNYRAGSDIDLAVVAPGMDTQSFTRLWSELDSLPLIFKLDLVHWDTLNNTKLKTKISTEGKVFFEPDNTTATIE